MSDKYKVANDVATAVRSIEAMQTRIDNLDKYARSLVDGRFQHVELTMEECDANNPAMIKPVYQSLSADLDPDSPPPKNALPIGYIKMYPETTGPITAYITTIPADIAMAMVDTLMKRMKTELAMYHTTINKSIGSQSDDKPKKYSYNIPVKELKK